MFQAVIINFTMSRSWLTMRKIPRYTATAILFQVFCGAKPNLLQMQWPSSSETFYIVDMAALCRLRTLRPPMTWLDCETLLEKQQRQFSFIIASDAVD